MQNKKQRFLVLYDRAEVSSMKSILPINLKSQNIFMGFELWFKEALLLFRRHWFSNRAPFVCWLGLFHTAKEPLLVSHRASIRVRKSLD